MKHSFAVLLVMVFLNTQVFPLAQEAGPGQIVFNNFFAAEVEAPIKRLDGTGAGLNATAQLMLLNSIRCADRGAGGRAGLLFKICRV